MDENKNGIPLKTIKEGEQITKISVEDAYKLVNRVTTLIDDSYNKCMDILESINRDYEDGDNKWNGYLIPGKGVSKPCNGDKFDEILGNEIAFKKAKLNANIKKCNLLFRIMNVYQNTIDKLYFNEVQKLGGYIHSDLKDLRKYNPDYLMDEDSWWNFIIEDDEVQE